jgi:hypothetical protein
MLKRVVLVMCLSGCVPATSSNLETGSEGWETFYDGPAISLVCDEPDSVDQKRIKVTSRLNDVFGERYFFTSSDPDIQKITLNWESNELQIALGEPMTKEGIGNRELRLYGLNAGCFVRFITESITITEYGEFLSDYDPFIGMQDARPGSIEFLSAVRRSDGASYVYHALVRDGRLSVPE